MLRPRLHVVVQPNRIAITNVDSGKMASVDAPFSCTHLLVEAADIFEHACSQAANQVARGFWLFPRVTVSTEGWSIHNIEAKIILDAWKNVGASTVVLAESVQRLEEQGQARSAYVAAAQRKR